MFSSIGAGRTVGGLMALTAVACSGSDAQKSGPSDGMGGYFSLNRGGASGANPSDPITVPTTFVPADIGGYALGDPTNGDAVAGTGTTAPGADGV